MEQFFKTLQLKPPQPERHGQPITHSHETTPSRLASKRAPLSAFGGPSKRQTPKTHISMHLSLDWHAWRSGVATTVAASKHPNANKQLKTSWNYNSLSALNLNLNWKIETAAKGSMDKVATKKEHVATVPNHLDWQLCSQWRSIWKMFNRRARKNCTRFLYSSSTFPPGVPRVYKSKWLWLRQLLDQVPLARRKWLTYIDMVRTMTITIDVCFTWPVNLKRNLLPQTVNWPYARQMDKVFHPECAAEQLQHGELSGECSLCCSWLREWCKILSKAGLRLVMVDPKRSACDKFTKDRGREVGQTKLPCMRDHLCVGPLSPHGSALFICHPITARDQSFQNIPLKHHPVLIVWRPRWKSTDSRISLEKH